MTFVRRFRSAAAFAAGVVFAALAHGAPFNPYPITPPVSALPLAPIPVQPAAGPQRATLGGTRPTFIWTQGGIVSTFPEPGPANFFMVCVYPVGGSCAWPGSWNAAATSISRTEIITLGGIRTGRYTYTFPAPSPLPANLLDRDVMWNVAACGSAAQSTCKFGVPRQTLFSTRNLVVTDVQFDRTSSGTQGWMRADLIAANDGTRDTGAFTTGMFLFEVLTDGMNCLTNPSAPGVQLSTDDAILSDGSFVPVDAIPANATVVGITRFGLDGSAVTAQSNGLAPGAEFSVGSVDLAFTWRSGETARGFVGGGFADNLPEQFGEVGSAGTVAEPSAVKEFSESDNTRFECRMVFK